MKAELFALMFLCLGGMLAVSARTVDDSNSSAEEAQQMERRYAESTLASEISKLMDSMGQKNFVKFLLDQREKRSKQTMMLEDPEFCKDLLEKDLTLWLLNKQERSKNIGVQQRAA